MDSKFPNLFLPTFLNSLSVCVLFLSLVSLIFNKFPILFQKHVSVFSVSTARRWDIVFISFESLDNLFRGLIIRRHPFRKKLCQSLVQTEDADLCIIDKFQCAPTNWWRCVIISSVYSSRLKVCHSTPPYRFLSGLGSAEDLRTPQQALSFSIPIIRPSIQL